MRSAAFVNGAAVIEYGAPSCMDDRAPNFKAHFVEPDSGACR
jgi:hypothetical protein